ncbi:MAG: lipoyl domain-containing protein, partial [Planctomycetes bacterium]|nr:lipoyl domain-containing protein [Planctomycetota bacterium]
MHNVLIPALGESITEGVISKWLVADGAAVGESTPILELETDKITTEIQAGAAGVLRRKAADGATIKVGAVAAVIEA